MKLFLRAFADCENDPEAADLLLRKIRAALPTWVSAEASPPKRYWKMPELYEFTFNLSPADSDVFDEVIASSSAGWIHSASAADRSSVWNRSNDLCFLAPEVAWAEIQHFQPAP